jgi:hypothetical protein
LKKFKLKVGQLNIGSTTDQKYPTVSLFENYGALKISAGSAHLTFLRSQDSCYGKQPSDTTICSGNGVCVKGICSCEAFFFGKECEFTTCFGKNSNSSSIVCSGKGICTEKDSCFCQTGYNGKECENETPVDENTFVYAFGYNNV